MYASHFLADGFGDPSPTQLLSINTQHFFDVNMNLFLLLGLQRMSPESKVLYFETRDHCFDGFFVCLYINILSNVKSVKFFQYFFSKIRSFLHLSFNIVDNKCNIILV